MTSKDVRSTKRKRNITRVAVAVIACMLVIGTGSVAYAMDLGGIQRIIQIWIHGDQTDAILNVNDGSYTIDYTDKNGNHVEGGGGGIAFDEDGTERPLTEEELLEHLYEPEVSYEEDGSVWVYYYDQKMEITDKFKNNVCYVQLKHDDDVIYMTIKYKDGYTMSRHGYDETYEKEMYVESAD